VNDVVLATATGALRSYLQSIDALPDRPLLASCPVSIREDNDDIESANKVSSMFVPLPTQLDDPADRVEALRIATRGAKEEHNAVGARTIMELGELGGPRTFGLASRLLGGLAARGPVPVNVVISNVPGPPLPLYLAGARLVSMLPLGPPIDGAGLNITVLSYIDRIDWGFIACRELAPHFHRLADAIPDAHAELKKLAGI
jgi:WS/DGAT/MGAT family acyltransferase